jgi:hypothetical protein
MVEFFSTMPRYQSCEILLSSRLFRTSCSLILRSIAIWSDRFVHLNLGKYVSDHRSEEYLSLAFPPVLKKKKKS